MSGTAVDATVLVAALLSWHEAHDRAFATLSAVLRDEQSVLVPVAALLESYAVMTRLPAAHRLAPADAAQLLIRALSPHCRLLSFPRENAWDTLQALAERDVRGETTGEAVLLESAQAGNATRLLTLEPRAFAPCQPTGIEVVAV